MRTWPVVAPPLPSPKAAPAPEAEAAPTASAVVEPSVMPRTRRNADTFVPMVPMPTPRPIGGRSGPVAPRTPPAPPAARDDGKGGYDGCKGKGKGKIAEPAAKKRPMQPRDPPPSALLQQGQRASPYAGAASSSWDDNRGEDYS